MTVTNDKYPLTCKYLILGIWGGYKCSKYGQKVSESYYRFPEKLSVCLKNRTTAVNGAKEEKDYD